MNQEDLWQIRNIGSDKKLALFFIRPFIQFLEGSGDSPQSSSFGSVAKTLGFSDQCKRLISPAVDSVNAVQ
ncbi:MAG: hypothetical protein ACI8Q3_001870, partial [Marinomonas primoryensis]